MGTGWRTEGVSKGPTKKAPWSPRSVRTISSGAVESHGGSEGDFSSKVNAARVSSKDSNSGKPKASQNHPAYAIAGTLVPPAPLRGFQFTTAYCRYVGPVGPVPYNFTTRS